MDEEDSAKASQNAVGVRLSLDRYRPREPGEVCRLKTWSTCRFFIEPFHFVAR
jgi:hypothetical protein